jgi:hypothetical protein
VVDSKQLARHFSYDELAQLYQFEFDVEDDPMDKYDVTRVHDKVLRHLINEYSDTIVSYREHDSFLIHHDEDNLTVEEQIQAKDEGYFISLFFVYLNKIYLLDENPAARLRPRDNIDRGDDSSISFPNIQSHTI